MSAQEHSGVAPAPVATDAPRVSVGITAYQRAAFLPFALASVLEQSFAALEVVVSNNGASEAVAEAVSPYLQDRRARHMPLPDVVSMAANWTNALTVGSGEYVAILNDDDLWDTSFLAARVAALDAHPECGFAFSPWRLIDVDGAEIARSQPVFAEGVVSRSVLARQFVRRNLLVPSTILLRRSAVEAVGPRFDDRWHYTDWEMWARVASRFPAYYLPTVDNSTRRHPDAVTVTSIEHPGPLIATVAHIEEMMTANVDGFRLGWFERRRGRATALLETARQSQLTAGWRACRPAYLRALRYWPPGLLSRPSLGIIAASVLGDRVSSVRRRYREAVATEPD